MRGNPEQDRASRTIPSSAAWLPRSVEEEEEEEEDEDDFILADIVQGLEIAQARCCGSE